VPINAPKNNARTNQRDGTLTYLVDNAGENPHVNYEPSSMGGLHEAPKPKHDYHQHVEGYLGCYQYSRCQDDYEQAGERYRTFEEWEREDLINNLVADMKACPEHIALRMVWHFWHCDPDYGTRVAQGAGIDLEKAKSLPPLEGKPAPGQARAAAGGKPKKGAQPHSQAAE